MLDLNDIKELNTKKSKVTLKNIIIVSAIIVLTILLVLFLFKNSKNKSNPEDVNEIKKIIEEGTTSLKASDRHNLILKRLEKRELLITEEEKFNTKKIKSDARIKQLKSEGIRSDILEMLIKLKEEELLLGDDVYIESSNTLKIGKIDNTTFSYEIKIKSVQEVLAEETRLEKQEEMIPLSVYLKRKEEEKEKEEAEKQKKEDEKKDKLEEDIKENQETENINENNNDNETQE